MGIAVLLTIARRMPNHLAGAGAGSTDT
jgi:hypothetical protein